MMRKRRVMLSRKRILIIIFSWKNICEEEKLCVELSVLRNFYLSLNAKIFFSFRFPLYFVAGRAKAGWVLNQVNKMSHANCRILIRLNNNPNAIYSPGQVVSGKCKINIITELIYHEIWYVLLTFKGKVIFTLAAKMGLRGKSVFLYFKKSAMKFHNVELNGGATMSVFRINIICVLLLYF